ncbi:hypothetical protein J6590_051919 [Homalodisca vitripennis]|nr:hypothetical protein J6590_051919 [Homalodisca vitripennis]
MNFVPLMYEVEGGDEWGERQLDGSYTGLLGEVMGGRAQLAIGNLQHSLYTLRLVDLSRPYMTQCFTFLTPESRSDNSWQTLVLPFLLNVWVAVLVTLFLGGFIFFSLAQFHRYLESSHQRHYKRKHNIQRKMAWLKNLNLATFSLKKKQNFNRRDADEESGNQQGVTPLMDGNTMKESQGLFIFEELENSILYTYGMLVSISLPKMPSGWALRMMTGWWWFYCLLVIVSYRASLTAILAKPEPK